MIPILSDVHRYIFHVISCQSVISQEVLKKNNIVPMCSTAINFFSHIYIKKKYIQKKGENVPIFGFHKMKWTFDNCTNYHLIKDAG